MKKEGNINSLVNTENRLRQKQLLHRSIGSCCCWGLIYLLSLCVGKKNVPDLNTNPIKEPE